MIVSKYELTESYDRIYASYFFGITSVCIHIHIHESESEIEKKRKFEKSKYTNSIVDKKRSCMITFKRELKCLYGRFFTLFFHNHNHMYTNIYT